MDSFAQRLELLAAGRKLTPWLTALGWTTRDVGRARNNNHIPGPKKLLLLLQKERVNLSWLIAGVGSPHLDPALKSAESKVTYQVRSVAAQQLVNLLPDLPDEAVKALLKTAQLLKKA